MFTPRCELEYLDGASCNYPFLRNRSNRGTRCGERVKRFKHRSSDSSEDLNELKIFVKEWLIISQSFQSQRIMLIA